MKLPEDVRLVGATANEVRLPKGIRVTGDARDAIVVLRDASHETAAHQVPEPMHGGAIFIFPDEAREGGFLGRFRPKKAASRAIRATALLTRGYVDIGASEIDGIDWVYGKAPP